MHFSKRAALFGLAMFGAAALAASADNIMQKAINDPGAFWVTWGNVKTNYVDAPMVKGGAAERVTISPKPANPWDAGASIVISKPVHKGDVLLLMFWARAEKLPAGSDLVMLSGRIYENTPSGAGVSPQTTFLIGGQWKLYYANGTAAKDYPVGTLSAGMALGTGDQVIDFGPVHVLDLGPNYNLNWLPHN
ncbi:MAG: hypothetical protein KGJ79_15805 [Alphaproteobacteria bacterium]|nr:hypothetical protein [Alphaproteobacteria bacterium]MDE2494443.1 hypothetical protein [Alphaproteobacteria bacterium]